MCLQEAALTGQTHLPLFQWEHHYLQSLPVQFISYGCIQSTILASTEWLP